MTSLARPSHIVSLATNSILVAVDVRVWTATKQDKSSSQEFTDSKKADPNAARVTQHLFADNPKHKKILNYRQTIYNFMQHYTYPWTAGTQILAVENLPLFMGKYQEHEQEFNKLVDEFISDYDSAVSDIAFKSLNQTGGMGSLFKRENYPTKEQARAKFGIDLYTSEVPEGDFRVQVANDLADDLHRNFEQQHQRLLGDIFFKQSEQLVSVMESISHCCDVETVTEADGSQKIKRRKLYDSTIERALELCTLFQSFNVTDNPDLEEARARLQAVLQNVSPDIIRQSDALRVQVKSEVDDILAKFKI